MRIGLFIGDTTADVRTDVAALIDSARWAEANGFSTGWVPHIPWSLDGLTGLALCGSATTRIELGTAVMPTYPRHPLAMAQQALSTQAAMGGRLALGIGPSHPVVIERMHGMAYDRPAAHTREYVEVLRAAAAGPGIVTYSGKHFETAALLDVPGGTPFPILVAALAPRMLQLAGEVADGTITYWADEHAIESHVVPLITSSAAAAVGRPAPRIVVGLPVAVVDDVAGAREQAVQVFQGYTGIPTYQRILDRGDSGSPVDVAAIGDEKAVLQRLESFAAAGATDFAAAIIGVGPDPEATRRRTADFLASVTPDVGGN